LKAAAWEGRLNQALFVQLKYMLCAWAAVGKFLFQILCPHKNHLHCITSCSLFQQLIATINIILLDMRTLVWQLA
jgi:hypothetical protein